ncbi:MAG: tetratricopeptide repeat protein [Candidatus Cryptobacteroides sp.]
MDRIYNISLVCIAALFLCAHPASAQLPTAAAQRENMVLVAVDRFDSGDAEGAKKILKEVLDADPSNDAANYYMAMSCIAGNDTAKAEVYLKKAAELDPGNFWYRYRLAGLYAVTSRKELTVSMYEKLLEDFPRRSELYFDLVELYSSQGENEKALETLDEVETIFGKTESTAMFRFNLLHRMQRGEEAFASLEEYNKEYSSPYVLSTLADWQMSMYNDSTALAYYNEALDIAPDYAPALLGKAETLRMTRKYDSYFSVLNRFVSLEDYLAEGKSDYLMALVQRTDPKFLKTFTPQLDTVFTNVLRVHPADSSILRAGAIYYYSTGRNDLADSCFLKNTRIWSKSVSAAADYVEFLMYAGKWQELSQEGRAAFDRFPDPAFLEMASVGDYNMKEYDKVLDICFKVLEVAPKDSSATLRAWSTAGDIYHQKGDSKKAYKAYEKALKVNPDYVYVLNNYAYYLSMEGKNLKKAYAMSKKTVEAEPDNSTYLDTFGWILYLQGKPLEAKAFFKHAMLYGGKESVVVMDHYAEVLYALKEYDLAFVYWNLALKKNNGEVPDLEERINRRRQASGQ